MPLFEYRLFPVCSPKLRASLGERPQPADLLRLPLVVIYSEARQWDFWFEAAGVAYAPDSQVVVDTLALALEFALCGSGVALVNGPFVDAELASGRLVRPVAHEAQCPGAWGLICRREVRDTPRVAAFIEFLAAQRTS
jgi:LysR family glycine cleavage system transcriptional activator